MPSLGKGALPLGLVRSDARRKIKTKPLIRGRAALTDGEPDHTQRGLSRSDSRIFREFIDIGEYDVGARTRTHDEPCVVRLLRWRRFFDDWGARCTWLPACSERQGPSSVRATIALD